MILISVSRSIDARSVSVDVEKLQSQCIDDNDADAHDPALIEINNKEPISCDISFKGKRLHPLWLRERCKCEVNSVQAVTGQPKWQPHEFRSDMKILDARVVPSAVSSSHDQGELQVLFSDGHESVFHV